MVSPDGNGRMSRLLTLLLLYRSGYLVGKYISIEKLISDTKETYYEALQASSCNWHEGTNDYAPFVTYMLGVLAAAYRDFESRIELLTTKGPGARDHQKSPWQDHQERDHGTVPGYQPDYRPARAGRAAEIRRDHQAQRRTVYGVCLEWGVSRDEKIRSRKSIKACQSKKQDGAELPRHQMTECILPRECECA